MQKKMFKIEQFGMSFELGTENATSEEIIFFFVFLQTRELIITGVSEFVANE